jgi:hypothetical protein
VTPEERRKLDFLYRNEMAEMYGALFAVVFFALMLLASWFYS